MRIKVLLATFLLSLGLFVSNAQAVKYWGDTLLTDEAVDFKEQASSPTNPSTDRWKLYFKSDGSVYKLDEAGVETELASKASEIQDSDGDTKVQTEEGADDDTIRFDALGSEVGTWTSSLLTTTTPVTVGGEVKTTGIEDADGDTAVKVEESADEDIIRFDVAGTEYAKFISTGIARFHIKSNANQLFLEQSNQEHGWTLEVDDATGALRFFREQSGGSEYLTLLANGNVGIRSTSPNSALRVDGDVAADKFKDTSNFSYFVDPGNASNAGTFNGPVTIGNTSPDASALLDMVSTTKGLGLPSQTTTERDAISTPRDGLMVYDETSDAVSVRANGSWANLVTSAGAGAITCETSQSTSSGTTFDFTGLPSGINWIAVIFSNVSLDGTDQIEVHLGDSGGVETSGYVGVSVTSGEAVATSSVGFPIRLGAASNGVNGSMILTRLSGNTWTSSHAMGRNGAAAEITGGGRKGLSAELDRIQISRSGSNNYDSGEVNVCHE